MKLYILNGDPPHQNMGGEETVYNITAQAHPFTYSFILTVYILYDTVFLNTFSHPCVSSFQSVDNKHKVNNYYVLYYIKLPVWKMIYVLSIST
jgi:hypothetical protein